MGAERSRRAALFCADLAADPLAALAAPGWLSPGWFAPELRAELIEHFSTSAPQHLLLTGALPNERALEVARGLARARFGESESVEAPAVADPAALDGAAGAFARWLLDPATARLHLRLAGTAPDRPLRRTQLDLRRATRGQRAGAVCEASDADTLVARYTFARGVSGGALRVSVGGHADPRVFPAAFNQGLVLAGRGLVWQLDPVRAGTRYDLTVRWTLGD